MQIDLTQTIKTLSGEKIKLGLSSDSQFVFQNIMKAVEELFQKEFTPDKASSLLKALISSLEKMNLVPEEATIKAIYMGALLSGSQNSDVVAKLKEYRLLKQISDNDVIDLSYSEAQDMLKRVASSYSSILILGRISELTVEKFSEYVSFEL